MYNMTVQWTRGPGATPSSPLSPLVCLSLESGAGIDTPPFGTIMRPELELRSMSVIPIPAHAYKTHSSTDSIIPETRPKSRCANLMRMSKMRGFCMTGNRLQFRINLMPIRNCNKVIYNIKLEAAQVLCKIEFTHREKYLRHSHSLYPMKLYLLLIPSKSFLTFTAVIFFLPSVSQFVLC